MADRVGGIYAEAELDITKFEQAVGRLDEQASRIAQAMARAASGVDGLSARLAASGRAIGASFSAGLASGIASGRSGVVASAVRVAEAAASAVRASLQIHSPSRLTRGYGEDFDMGFVRGVMDDLPEIERAVRAAVRVDPPVREKQAAAPAPTQKAVFSIDYDALARAMDERRQVLTLNGRRIAELNAEATARAQNARARDVSLRYGGK